MNNISAVNNGHSSRLKHFFSSSFLDSEKPKRNAV